MWYSINRKAPLELFDLKPEWVEAVFKAKESLPNTTSEPRPEKTGYLHMRKQRRRSASR